MSRRVIGITGGIGSGKSVVSRICRLNGHEVYDCDAEAKRIMDSSEAIKSGLCDLFGEEAVDGEGCINRAHVAAKAFADKSLMAQLNALVHHHVRCDLEARIAAGGREPLTEESAINEAEEGEPIFVESAINEAEEGEPIFVESAILAGSGLQDLCDEIWLVDAPEQLRIERVVCRSGLTSEQVKARINSQVAEFDALDAAKVVKIVNDGRHSLLQQLKNKI